MECLNSILNNISTQPPIQWVPGGSFPGGKVAGGWS